MSIYFAFSDECGNYKKDRSVAFLNSHPYYIRSTLIIQAKYWKILNNGIRSLKDEYELPLDKEIKWAYLWNIRFYQKNKKEIPSNKEFKFLEKIKYNKLIEFVEKALKLIEQLDYKKIIITVTDNQTTFNINEKYLLKMHLQELMQRFQMEIQNSEENLGILFIDPISHEKNEYLREIYSELYQNGDYIDSYSHIKDSINIENSHQSVGIQIADYISGSYSALLKSINSDHYEKGKQIFMESVYPFLRRSHDANVMGYGIREVPRDLFLRRNIIRAIRKATKEKEGK